MSSRRDAILEEIDCWRRGGFSSPGCSWLSERYALRMRLRISELEAELDALNWTEETAIVQEILKGENFE